MDELGKLTDAVFLSAPSARRARRDQQQKRKSQSISIRALREEGDLRALRAAVRCRSISIRALREEGDAEVLLRRPPPCRISIRALREEGDEAVVVDIICPAISIRALREEGDMPVIVTTNCGTEISIRALREEGDPWPGVVFAHKTLISIHALREEGDHCNRLLQIFISISIHALREEGDTSLSRLRHDMADFYPRPPRGGRLPVRSTSAKTRTISIHALREEGDPMRLSSSAPRRLFLSTPSARRATRCGFPVLRRAGYFYPRPPRGGRPLVSAVLSPR